MLPRGTVELVALLAALEEQGWVATEEQDRELEKHVENTQSTASELFWNDAYLERLKAVEELIRKHRKALEVGDAVLRAKLAAVMQRLPDLEVTKGGNPKTEDEQGFCTVFLRSSQGAVDLAPGMTVEDVDPMYVEQKVEVTLVINKKSAGDEFRRQIEEAGDAEKIEGIRGLVFKREPSVTLIKTKAGKQALLEHEAGYVLGLAKPE